MEERDVDAKSMTFGNGVTIYLSGFMSRLYAGTLPGSTEQWSKDIEEALIDALRLGKVPEPGWQHMLNYFKGE